MNGHRFLRLLAAASFLGMGAAHASTITLGDPSPTVYDEDTFAMIDGGVSYWWTVSMGASDLAQLSGHVGAWSWDEDSSPGTDRGWTHTSHWVALTLTAPTKLTIRLENKGDVPSPSLFDPNAVAGNNLYPGLTLWSNWDGDGTDYDVYNNRGNVSWAEDLTYLDHIEGGTGHIIERTWTLPAGNYSIALGGNSPSTNAEGRQGYLATFTTNAVPEPGTAVLALVGGAAITLRRRRSQAASRSR
ncbi:PEP-CTERM sorting domain-containing protein [Verrucomicrobiota bacterium sgz303538]